MDEFGVPKKINRHVLKAVCELNNERKSKPNLSNICEIVQYTMRNNAPVVDLPSLVRKSLQNLSELGVIAKQGTMYYTSSDSLPSSSKLIKTSILKRNVKKEEKESNLNPNKRKRSVLSEDSISGSEIKKSRKRFRPNRKLTRKGRSVGLPKVKNYLTLKLERRSSDEKNNFGSEEENKDENKSVSSSTDLKLFYSGTFKTKMHDPTEFDDSFKFNEHILQVQLDNESCNPIAAQSENRNNQLNEDDDIVGQLQHNIPIAPEPEPVLNDKKELDFGVCQEDDSNDIQKAPSASNTELEVIDRMTNNKMINAESNEETIINRNQDSKDNLCTLNEI